MCRAWRSLACSCSRLQHTRARCHLRLRSDPVAASTTYRAEQRGVQEEQTPRAVEHRRRSHRSRRSPGSGRTRRPAGSNGLPARSERPGRKAIKCPEGAMGPGGLPGKQGPEARRGGRRLLVARRVKGRVAFSCSPTTPVTQFSCAFLPHRRHLHRVRRFVSDGRRRRRHPTLVVALESHLIALDNGLVTAVVERVSGALFTPISRTLTVDPTINRRCHESGCSIEQSACGGVVCTGKICTRNGPFGRRLRALRVQPGVPWLTRRRASIVRVCRCHCSTRAFASSAPRPGGQLCGAGRLYERGAVRRRRLQNTNRCQTVAAGGAVTRCRLARCVTHLTSTSAMQRRCVPGCQTGGRSLLRRIGVHGTPTPFGICR